MSDFDCCKCNSTLSIEPEEEPLLINGEKSCVSCYANFSEQEISDLREANLRANAAIGDIANECKKYADENLALQQRVKELEGELDKEESRWQKAIYDLIQKMVPEANVDGGPSDSGDPLDFTLAEISQGIAHLSNQIYEMRNLQQKPN